MATNDAQIRALLDRRVEGMRQKDAAAFLEGYADSTVTFELAPPLVNKTPKRQMGDVLSDWFASKGGIDYELRDVVIRAGDQFAFCYSLNHLVERDDGGAVVNDMWFRSTLCFRKLEGRWVIEHEHNSTPFYMDGDARAALDLKPQ